MEQFRRYAVHDVEILRQQVHDLLGRITAKKAGTLKDETAWLIEWPATPDSQARWWHPQRGWTIDASRALRLSRKEDAEAIISEGKFVVGIVATEHAWVNLPASARPPPPPPQDSGGLVKKGL